MSHTVRILGVRFDDLSVDSAVTRLQEAARGAEALTVVFPNAATLNLAARSPTYRDILNSADFVFGDGTGVRWAARMRGVRLRANLNGTDVIPALLEATPGLRVYLLGGTEEVNAAAAAAAARKFPVDVVGRHHGFFDLDASADVLAAITAAAPDVLLVGFGNPLQEEWIAKNLNALHVPLTAAVGGLFGFWAGTRTRAPGLARRLGVEWVDILLREPHKAKRYLLGNPAFLARAVRSRSADLRR
ncbi:WecB/TagA/CpsF family glycosyltransferase [Tsukamurella paurometabola]|uniref:N-acetylmannosaminyltransferase n=1 Tax=Tsukamurella paurometabola TaxID=2061 RepID=A0A3P8MBU0_TSUPA|nr:WecB/TagA/CpsF family glycosyltransferase [Tsukamurella paurometabola]UEA81355.1 WecB/TagA/CpsF family glycosyltransferase [Tsukamurella paurometabola]VDR38336.1 Putative N-acetylmannosaminyltransferase [Tsukamurella paurometabola]